MGRVGGSAGPSSIAIATVVAGVTPAGAERPRAPLITRVARALGRIIVQDAHQGGPRSTTAVRASRRCCGTRVLTVYYRAMPGVYWKFGAYELRLTTRR